MYVLFEDMHDGEDFVVEATEAEWDALVAPALDWGFSIDGGTVDEDLLDILMERPRVDLRLSEVQAIGHVIPLV